MASQLERQQAELARYLLQRRAVLKGGAAALAGAAALPSFGRPASAAPAEAMQFIGWQYQPEIVAENVGIFSKLYDENVNYELVPGEYHAIRRDQADRRSAHRHDVLGRGPADPLEHRRLDAIPRGPPGHRGDQGRDVPDQRPQHVAGGRQPGRPALLHRLQFLRLQREASRRGQARAARDLGGVPRPVPQAEEGQDRRVSLHQRLGPAMGEPVLEPVLDLVLAGCEGVRRRAQARLQPGFPRRPGDAQDDLRRSS